MAWMWAKRRQLVWIGTAIIIILVLLYPVGLPMPITNEIKLAYGYVDSLPEGSKVLIQADHGSAYWAEYGITHITLFKHCFKKNLKVYNIHFRTTVPDAPDTTERALKFALEIFPEKVRGVDYVNLGFVPGAAATTILFCEDVRRVYSYDHFNTPIDEIPMMEGINDISDFDLVIAFDPGPSGTYYIYHDFLEPLAIKFIGVELTMNVPMALPYRTAGLVDALIGGAAGDAQYEYLSRFVGRGIASMDVTNVTLIFMLTIALLSNIPLILKRLKGVEKS